MKEKNRSYLNILFVTWDGPQTTYLESLFLPIFKWLAEDGFRFHVLQFTWGDTDRIERTRQACAAVGVSYQAIMVWRRPVALGSLLTAIKGVLDLRKAIRRYGIEAVMPRSTLPALTTLLALRGNPLPFIFDADGLPLDERVDFAGQSPSSLVYRVLRDIETQAVQRATVVMTRSNKAIDILRARAGAGTVREKFHVVGNGRDANLFNPKDVNTRDQLRQQLGLAESTPLLVYAGSIGPQYCLGEMLELLTYVRQRQADSHLLILTASPDSVADALIAHPELQFAVTTLTVPPADVPVYLASADAGLALRRTSFSMQAIAPIKLGEYLLCGLPVVATIGIGDTDALSPATSFLVERMDSVELKAAADWFIDGVLPQRDILRFTTREIGLSRFSLEACAEAYMKVFAVVRLAGLTKLTNRSHHPKDGI